MDYRVWTAAGAACLAVVGIAFAAAASASGPATGGGESGAERRVYIDPETGERRQPTAEERAGMSEESTAKSRAGEKKSRVIEGPGGSKMIIHDEDDWARHSTERPASEEGDTAD